MTVLRGRTLFLCLPLVLGHLLCGVGPIPFLTAESSNDLYFCGFWTCHVCWMYVSNTNHDRQRLIKNTHSLLSVQRLGIKVLEAYQHP